jgi:pantoate--beta-alanine ligase
VAGSLALVPTMGALHDGHAELIRLAGTLADAVAVSIFVNPLQFGPAEDLDRYPRTPERDLELLDRLGVGLVFAPGATEMYPTAGRRSPSTPARSAALLEGASRPGHFAGVLTVVTKLLGLVRPDVAVFGEKDYQQLALIRRTVADLELGVRIVGGPTVRDPDGLALSSRNRYLSPEQRQQALALSTGAAGRGRGRGRAAPAPCSRRPPSAARDRRRLPGPARRRSRPGAGGRPGPAARRRPGRHHPADRQRAADAGTRSERAGQRGTVSVPRLPRHLAAPEPGWTHSTDVVVAGSGIAGLSAALHARAAGHAVTVVTKVNVADGSTRWAQGGIAAALDPADSPAEHLADTLAAGVGLCDEAAVRVLVEEGPAGCAS